MIKTFSDLNKEVMNRLYNEGQFQDFTRRDGFTIYLGIRTAIKKNLRKGNILSFGSFWLYPKKNERFKKRNRSMKQFRLSKQP